MKKRARNEKTVAVLARRWAEQLGRWAIPASILDRAPESPWGFPPELFGRAADAALADRGASPSRRLAMEALSADGTVLDIGCGAGAASLPLAPPATGIVGVDESEAMLESFRARAAARAVSHSTALGRWPEVEGRVAAADVVVCHHVIYNVADAVPFIEALDRRARRRVVIELTAAHPQADLNDLWRSLHGIERPDRPVATDLVDLLEALGLAPGVERFAQPSLWAALDRDAQVAFARRRLCLGPERDADVDRLLAPSTERDLVTVWWDPPA